MEVGYSSEGKKPLWSVMIPTYNSEEFLEETLKSVIEQKYPLDRMEIVVVDNCSTDSTPKIVETVGKDVVIYSRNNENIGMVNNFNECIRKANGKYVHILNSDDIVLPGFYKEYERAFIDFPDVYLVSSKSEVIDEKGIKQGMTSVIPSLLVPSNDVSELLYINPFRTPSIVVKKDAYNIVGGFDPDLIQTFDWDMWVRVISKFKGLYIDKILSKYREHSNNGSSKAFSTGANILDTEKLFKKFERMNLGIRSEKYLEILRSVTRNQLIHFEYSNNTSGIKHLTRIHRRYYSFLRHISFIVKIRKDKLAMQVSEIIKGSRK